MNDIVYIMGTLVFFALMVAYVATCAWIGQDTDGPKTADDNR